MKFHVCPQTSAMPGGEGPVCDVLCTFSWDTSCISAPPPWAPNSRTQGSRNSPARAVPAAFRPAVPAASRPATAAGRRLRCLSRRVSPARRWRGRRGRSCPLSAPAAPPAVTAVWARSRWTHPRLAAAGGGASG